MKRSLENAGASFVFTDKMHLTIIEKCWQDHIAFYNGNKERNIEPDYEQAEFLGAMALNIINSLTQCPDDEEFRDMVIALYNNLGNILYIKENYQQASEYYIKVLELDPENKYALCEILYTYYHLSEEAIKQKRWQAAGEMLEEILKHRLPIAVVDACINAHAIWEFWYGDTLICLYPEILNVFNQYAEELAKQERYCDAIEYYSKGLEFFSFDLDQEHLAAIYKRMAELECKQHRLRNARDYYIKALELYTNSLTNEYSDTLLPKCYEILEALTNKAKVFHLDLKDILLRYEDLLKKTPTEFTLISQIHHFCRYSATVSLNDKKYHEVTYYFSMQEKYLNLMLQNLTSENQKAQIIIDKKQIIAAQFSLGLNLLNMTDIPEPTLTLNAIMNYQNSYDIKPFYIIILSLMANKNTDISYALSKICHFSHLYFAASAEPNKTLEALNMLDAILKSSNKISRLSFDAPVYTQDTIEKYVNEHSHNWKSVYNISYIGLTFPDKALHYKIDHSHLSIVQIREHIIKGRYWTAARHLELIGFVNDKTFSVADLLNKLTLDDIFKLSSDYEKSYNANKKEEEKSYHYLYLKKAVKSICYIQLACCFGVNDVQTGVTIPFELADKIIRYIPPLERAKMAKELAHFNPHIPRL